MSSWIRHSAAGRRLFAAALLLAFAMRVLIPTGFMPTQTAGGIVISLCTGQGPVNVVLLGGEEPAGHQQADGGPCMFAAGLAGGLLAPEALASVTAFSAAAARILGAAIADLTVHRLAAPPPPALGPPALS